MEQASQVMEISYLGVVISAISSFLLGGLWYSPILFGKRWMELNDFTEEKLKLGTARIFGISFLLQLVAVVILAAFLGKSGFVFSMFAGLMVGLGWVGTAMGTTYLFERKPIQLYLINAGYHVITFTLTGAIIGGFQA